MSSSPRAENIAVYTLVFSKTSERDGSIQIYL